MSYTLHIGTTYVRSGNTFSQTFFVLQGLPADTKILIVFDAAKELAQFTKIAKHIHDVNISVVSDLVSLLDFITSDHGVFASTTELLALDSDLGYIEKTHLLRVERNAEMSIDDCLCSLIDLGYSHSLHLSKPCTYRKEGDILTIRTIREARTIILSFFDTTLDEILVCDGPDIPVEKRDFFAFPSPEWNTLLPEIATRAASFENDIFSRLSNTVVVFNHLDFFDGLEIARSRCAKTIIFSGNIGNGEDLGISDLQIATISDLETIVREHGDHVHFYTKRRKPLDTFLEYNGLSCGQIHETTTTGLESFMRKKADREGEYYIADDILGNIFIRTRTRKSVAKNLDLLLDMRVGDYIVHRDHWIGVFREIVEKDTGGTKREYMSIEYAANDKLFVPLGEIHRVSKYIGEEHPHLTRLSTGEWKKTLEKTDEDVERIAQELLSIHASRRISRGFPFLPYPKEEAMFREAFRYEHTPDQKTAIEEIFGDMELPEPMDRLLAGDVGFGKTEVAMNAMYKAFLSGKQSIFISPLVVLAYEHGESLRARFSGFWVKTAVLTRLTSEREAKKILSDIRHGKIDCVIGTHRLLGEDVIFRDLGLLVIDEEHRFWVLDKEKIGAIKSNIDTLSLSATPIPRSLNLSLSWLKKISILSTPPPLKKAISTLVMRWNEDSIRQAIELELARGWQIVFLHNRIASIDSVRTRLEKLLGKKVRIAITHGRMNGIELEDRIIEFKEGKYDILLSTTVIENGVNFLNANTIFIDDAERFGLAQLHQLRGRVGRKDREAYCYLVYHSDHLEDDAKKRLLTIVNHSELGAGFEIAMRDLEIRGAGDILGIKQSGKTSDTGLSLYLRLLEEKIEELKSGQKKTSSTCTVELDLSYSIPESFFDSELDKIRFFRSIESMETMEDLDYAYETFREANDVLPESFENLFLLLRARLRIKEYGVVSLKKLGTNYVFDLDPRIPVETVRKLLDLDHRRNFILVTVHKIKVPVSCYENDRGFLEELVG